MVILSLDHCLLRVIFNFLHYFGMVYPIYFVFERRALKVILCGLKFLFLRPESTKILTRSFISFLQATEILDHWPTMTLSLIRI